jgi:hypothetical protein
MLFKNTPTLYPRYILPPTVKFIGKKVKVKVIPVTGTEGP